MSHDKHTPSDLAELIIRSLDGSITAEQFTRLDDKIRNNSEARAYYLEFITTYVGLMDLVGILPKLAEVVGKNETFDDNESIELSEKIIQDMGDSGPLRFAPDMSEEDKKRRIKMYARHQLEAFLEQEHKDFLPQVRSRAGWDISESVDKFSQTLTGLCRARVKVGKAIAAGIMLAAVVLIVGLYINEHRTVAILVDSVDTKWDIKVQNQTELRPQSMRLEQGYALIRFKRGAEVILQAPSTLRLQAPNKMFLESGWITAKVPPQATGFTVNTPSSRVIDFGTEFGLLVGTDSSSEVHVFEGKVGLKSGGIAGSTKQQEKLEEGDAAIIDTTGHIDRDNVEDRTRLFVHMIPKKDGFGFPGKRLNLADIVGGGNGLGTGVQGQGLDPSTGEVNLTARVINGHNNGFIRVPSLLFVDGVFIPDASVGPQIISSTGIVFRECPDTVGICHESISNGAMFHTKPLEPHPGYLKGQAYGTDETFSIGMHANTGITFDLGKIRSFMPVARIERFRATCGVSETVAQYVQRRVDPAKITVDFWVLVDGQVRFSRIMAAEPLSSEQIDIPLGPSDQFLTLITTNPDDCSFCWGMLAEPTLELTMNKLLQTETQ